MIGYLRGAALTFGLLLLVLAENFFGRELNTLFVRYPGIDKVLHVTEYLLVFLALHTIAGRTLSARSARRWVPVVATALLAFLDESVQSFAPARSVELLDLSADFSGLALGWVAVHRPRPAFASLVAATALGVATYATWHTYALLIDYSRGLRYSQQQDFVRARQHYRRAVAAGLRTPAVYNELAWVEVESGVGSPQAAVDYARKAVAMQPGNADILDTYGWALHYAGRSRDALTPLLEAYRRKPGMFCIDYHLGAVYLALGEADVAKRYLRSQTERAGTREAVFARRMLADMDGHR